MKVYLVGGAVRDELLGISVHDRDWVVVGSCLKEMLKKGYQQVGKDFPVFIHPVTHEQYALARTEKKNNMGGHKGFSVFFSKKVTLLEDLMRRDLTINAIAKDRLGNFIDPFCGRLDLKNRILRHVSVSFQDDPLRVLRVARFAAKLAHLGFVVAEETLQLMISICRNRELYFLSSERIWKEIEKGLSTSHPHVFLKVLFQCDALKYILPEIYTLYSFNYNRHNNFFYKNFKNVFLFQEIDRISMYTKDFTIRFIYVCQFVSLLYYVPVSNTIDSFFSKKAARCVKSMCLRLKVPKEIQRISELLCGFYNFLQHLYIQKAYLIVSFFNKMDIWRKPNRLQILKNLRFYNFNNNCVKKNLFYNSLGFILCKIFFVIKDVSIKSINVNNVLKGKEISKAIYFVRVKKLICWMKKKKFNKFFTFYN